MNNPISKNHDVHIGSGKAMIAALIQALAALSSCALKRIKEVKKKLFEPHDMLEQEATSKNDYYKIAWLYIYKRLFMVLLILLIVAATVLIYLIPNYLFREEKLYTNSQQLRSVTGKAQIYVKEDPKDQLLYAGMVEDGIYNGRGKLYKNGQLLYEGEFKEGDYSGVGQLFKGGQVVYRGNFDNSRMNGQGTQFYRNGNPMYIGEYRNGKFSGSGKCFDKAGLLQYEGEFYMGSRHGEGKLFSASGSLVYEGSFAKDRFNGFGITYGSKGEITYKGYFKDNLPIYEEFVGLPESRLKELLGEPSLIELPQGAANPGAVPDLTQALSKYQLAMLLTSPGLAAKRFDYNEASFSLILETSEEEPLKYQVTRILLWGGQTSASFDLSQPSSRVFAQDQVEKISNADYGLKNSCVYMNGYKYMLYSYPDEETVFLEIQGISMK